MTEQMKERQKVFQYLHIHTFNLFDVRCNAGNRPIFFSLKSSFGNLYWFFKPVVHYNEALLFMRSFNVVNFVIVLK